MCIYSIPYILDYVKLFRIPKNTMTFSITISTDSTILTLDQAVYLNATVITVKLLDAGADAAR